MNYRHAYHAGNHADVFKHAVLARVLVHLAKKDKPFRVLDLHSGAGIYDLTGPEAGKTLEWQAGVARLGEPLEDAAAEALLAPWRRVLARVNPQSGLAHTPGSPEFARVLMREDDRLIANELHPEDRAALARAYGFDRRVTVAGLDAAIAIKAHLPPPERRGLVLIDPPYERSDEAEAAVRMLAEGHRRFATGIFLLWYPVTGDGLDQRLLAMAGALSLPRLLKAELMVRAARHGGGLAGSGLLIVNPPWRLDAELEVLLPPLAARLAQDARAESKLEWMAARA